VPNALLQIAPIVALLILGCCIGTFVERAHFRRLAVRENALGHMLVTDTRAIPTGCATQPCGLVVGEVVIASDYFKTFAAKIRKIVGGELRSYETMMERARREAIIRMKESADRMGANRVINIRLASSNIGGFRRRQNAAMVEIYAYGTAIYVPQSS
jgi:uncharacterized protein YbjQ (UPF0145 family)